METLAGLVDRPSPVDTIRFRMDQLDLGQTQVVTLVRLQKSRISEALNGKRTLALELIRLFHEKLRIPAEMLISRAGSSASS